MQILSISLENFRNLELTRLTFEPGIPQFFVGSNGQGKSNLLEALGLITAVRSFRTHELSPLIHKGKRRARILYEVEHSPSERMEVSIELGSKERAIQVDGVPEPRLSAFVGRFPAVVFSTDDIQLVKGSPQGRRRFFDLLFSVADPRYLQILQSYHRTLRERNMALKQSMNHAVIAAFDHPLARWGAALISLRQEGVASFTGLFNDRYLGIAREAEQGVVALRSSLEPMDEDAYRKSLCASIERDAIMGTTTIGPHRDDYPLYIENNPARTHGSDGQQRTLALALKLAQIDLIRSRRQLQPVILLDDILGELDNLRKERFWESLDRNHQIFATGTSLPAPGQGGGAWKVFQVIGGRCSNA